ncbi:hypothetical protein HZA45_01350 [Candidatus Peregrinibacteria bacterium]|nr:hypothetical protein [Candidatus Peregrinibacteria bacterium]
MSPTQLRRIYAFSDTYGRSKNPFLQDDADSLISTDFRSFPLQTVRREFDIYGRENMTAHILRLIFQLHQEIAESEYMPEEIHGAFMQTMTGIFINSAPRVGKQNGDPFYVATVKDKNIRIVTTSPEGLSSVKEEIGSIAHLPNESNKIYGTTEQFRSSYTAFLLHPDHNLPLIEDSLSIIPDFPEDSWELSYVDRFGNIMTFTKNPEKVWQDVLKKGSNGEKPVTLLIGHTSQEVHLGISLKDSEPGSLVLYPNGDLEILRKWEAGDDSIARLRKSAYFQFAKPEVGARVRVL